MATRTATTGDLSVTTTSRIDQASLLVQILNGRLGEQTDNAMQLLGSYPKPPTYERFVKDHPRSSQGYKDVQGLLMCGETIATFVKQGILDRDLVFDLIWVSGAWAKVEKIAGHEREAQGNASIYENFEALAELQS